MKTLSLPVIATSLMLAMPAFADDSHHPAQPGATQASLTQPDGKTMQQMQNNLAMMQKQLERLGKANTAEERQKIMNEHMQMMQANMGMMHGMMGQGMQGGMGMMGQGMQGGNGIMGHAMPGSPAKQAN